jgi:hypothetical protein
MNEYAVRRQFFRELVAVGTAISLVIALSQTIVTFHLRLSEDWLINDLINLEKSLEPISKSVLTGLLHLINAGGMGNFCASIGIIGAAIIYPVCKVGNRIASVGFLGNLFSEEVRRRTAWVDFGGQFGWVEAFTCAVMLTTLGTIQGVDMKPGIAFYSYIVFAILSDHLWKRLAEA